MNEETRYKAICRYVSERPWAIMPSALLTIRNFLEFKAAGGELSVEEVRDKIGAAASRQKTPSRGAIRVIPIVGSLVPHADLMTEISGGTTYDGIQAQLHEALQDESIGTIVLDIDSPGGDVSLLGETAKLIREARDRKPIIGVANTTAGSAAYYLLAQCSEAVCSPSGMVGSIGTISIHSDDSVMLEKLGVTETVVTYGEHKGELWGPLSDDARAELQRVVDSYGREFVADVAKGRGIDRSKVENEFGQGRMLRPQDALRVGMIDRVASMDDTIARLAGGRRSSGTRAEAETELVAALANTGAAPREIEVVFTGNVQLDSQAVAAATTRRHLPARTVAAAADRDLTPRSNHASRKEPGMDPENSTQTEPRTQEGILARMEAVAAEQAELNEKWAGQLMTGEDLGRFEALEAEHDLLDRTVKQMAMRQRVIEQKARNGQTVPGDGAEPVETKAIDWDGGTTAKTRRRLPANLFDLAAYRGEAKSLDDLAGLWNQAAARVNEGLPYETDDQARVRGFVERLLTRDDTEGKPSESFAHRILVTGNPEYDRAFGQHIMGRPMTSHQKALVEAAVSHTGLSTETPVPVTIDPTVLLTSDGQVNPLRQLARVVSITGNKWRGISSDGATVAYEAELTQVGEQTPSFDTPEATVEKAHGYVEFSIEVDQDWPSLRENLSMMFADAKDAKEAEKFLLGDGSDEPEGLITALVADGNSEVETASATTFALGDVYALKAALPPRWRARAAWLANDAVFDAVRGFGDESNNTFWVDLNDDRPARLLGKPVYEASEMASDVDGAGEVTAVYGDFSRGFVIVDRVGMNVELIPHVLGANRRPIGARALYAYFRNTSMLMTAKAFRYLTVKAS